MMLINTCICNVTQDNLLQPSQIHQKNMIIDKYWANPEDSGEIDSLLPSIQQAQPTVQEISALDFIDSESAILPEIKINCTFSSSQRTQYRDYDSLEKWDVAPDVQAWQPSETFLNGRIDRDVFLHYNSSPCSNEPAINSRFSYICGVLAKLIHTLTFQEDKQTDSGNQRRPDVLWTTPLEKTPISPWEGKPPFDIDDLVDENLPTNVKSALRQLNQYLYDVGVSPSFGVLYTYLNFFFVRRESTSREENGRLYISSAFPYNNSNPTIMRCLAFILYKSCESFNQHKLLTQQRNAFAFTEDDV